MESSRIGLDLQEEILTAAPSQSIDTKRKLDMTFQCVSYECRDRVAYILHNRPEARNAESKALLQEMDDALKLAVADPEVRVIVIGGVGDHFSAGHDLKSNGGVPVQHTVESRWEVEERYFLQYSLNIWDCPKPTIARVQGACIAGGFMVANMCDLIVASDDAFFSDPVCQSMAASAVEVLVHPWVLGLRKAKEFLFTGQRLSAEDAEKWGMVNRVVPRTELDAATHALALRIAQAAPFTIKLTKRSLNRTADIQGFRNAVQAHFDTHQLSHRTDEHLSLRASAKSDKLIAAGKAMAAQ
jgi:enoyl-CoA hydratase